MTPSTRSDDTTTPPLQNFNHTYSRYYQCPWFHRIQFPCMYRHMCAKKVHAAKENDSYVRKRVIEVSGVAGCLFRIVWSPTQYEPATFSTANTFISTSVGFLWGNMLWTKYIALFRLIIYWAECSLSKKIPWRPNTCFKASRVAMAVDSMILRVKKFWKRYHTNYPYRRLRVTLKTENNPRNTFAWQGHWTYLTLHTFVFEVTNEVVSLMNRFSFWNELHQLWRKEKTRLPLFLHPKEYAQKVKTLKEEKMSPLLARWDPKAPTHHFFGRTWLHLVTTSAICFWAMIPLLTTELLLLSD